MSSTTISQSTSFQIFHNIAQIFNIINLAIKEEDIVIDFAHFNSQGLESTFSLSSIENVQRKPFNEAVMSFKSKNPQIEEFKVKYKRPGKNVRFYLKIINQTKLDEPIIS